jgi:hypothetical protein
MAAGVSGRSKWRPQRTGRDRNGVRPARPELSGTRIGHPSVRVAEMEAGLSGRSEVPLPFHIGQVVFAPQSSPVAGVSQVEHQPDQAVEAAMESGLGGRSQTARSTTTTWNAWRRNGVRPGGRSQSTRG